MKVNLCLLKQLLLVFLNHYEESHISRSLFSLANIEALRDLHPGKFLDTVFGSPRGYGSFAGKGNKIHQHRGECRCLVKSCESPNLHNTLVLQKEKLRKIRELHPPQHSEIGGSSRGLQFGTHLVAITNPNNPSRDPTKHCNYH